MKSFILSIVMFLMLIAGPALSQDAYDGSTNLTCSSITGVVCAEKLKCREGSAKDFEVPKFVTLKFSAGEIELKYRPEKKRTVKMGDIHKDGTYLITQGVYSEKDQLQGAWQFVVNQKTGELHISGLEHGFGYFFDGACKK